MRAGKLLNLFLPISILLAAGFSSSAQPCTVLGQTPSTAFPVCGVSTFKQDSVPLCGNKLIPVGCHDNAQYSDRNPFWYKFTCFTGGTLGFEITPIMNSDDYDWQLFDITGQDPTAVYSNPNLFVCGNWSSNSGSTGASSKGAAPLNCAGPTYPNQSAMPTLIAGHIYLLLVSHFTDTQSGYSLSFSGGTASITDTTKPALAGTKAICNSIVEVILNKKMSCASLAADGTDFTIAPLPPGIRIAGAAAGSCSAGFDLDTVTLNLSGDLPPGSYTLAAAVGSDGNTLLDDCGTEVPAGQALPLSITPPQPAPLDSLTPPSCAPELLQLVFSAPIQCSTIAADGSDFTVTGTQPVTVIGAGGDCTANGLTNTIRIRLSAPILTAGSFRLTLRQGSDGNTLVNACGLQTLPASLGFTTLDTVSAAAYSGKVLPGCKQDSIQYSYPAENGVNQWLWTFNGTDSSLVQDPPDRLYPLYGAESMQLIVSNGFCTDTARDTVFLNNALQVKFEGPSILCPKDYAQFLNGSEGVVSSWYWDFGDGTSSTLQAPADHLYPTTGAVTDYTVTLIGTNDIGCSDTAVRRIEVLRSCFIAVPSAFTPNGDGINDYLYPLNALKAVNLIFRVYSRTGQLVFATTDWQKKWDGTIDGHPQPAGTFVWTLEYTDGDTGKRIFQKGTTVLIR